jgi:tetratricopeptide (TPR) repeat protein
MNLQLRQVLYAASEDAGHFYKNGLLEDALARIEKIPVQDRDALLWRQHGKILFELGRTPEAIHSINRAIDLYPDHPFSYEVLGDIEHQAGKYKDAISHYETAVEKSRLRGNPSATLDYMGRIVDCHYKDANYVAAHASVRQLLALNPGYPKGIRLQIQILFKLNMMEEAEAAVDKRLALQIPQRDPENHMYAQTQKISCLLARGAVVDAFEINQQQYARDPKSPKVLALRARCLAGLGRTEEAEQCIDEILRMNPQDLKARGQKFLLCLALNDITAATGEIHNMLTIQPRNALVLFYAAYMSFIQKKYGQATNYAQALSQKTYFKNAMLLLKTLTISNVISHQEYMQTLNRYRASGSIRVEDSSFVLDYDFEKSVTDLATSMDIVIVSAQSPGYPPAWPAWNPR